MPPDARPALRALAIPVAPLALLAVVAPHAPRAARLDPALAAIRFPLDGEGLYAFIAFVCAALTVTLSSALAPRPLLTKPRNSLRSVALGVAVSLASFTILHAAPGLSGVLGAIGIILAACAIGTQVGARVESPGHILPVALLSAAVDLWSVTAASGPTHMIVHTPALLRLLTITASVPMEPLPEPQIGFGDVVFAALYHAIGARFGLSLRRTAAAIFVGVLLAGITSAALAAPVPALPALGLAMLVAHREARRVPKADQRTALFTGALLIASIARAAVVFTR
jgi:hypothetical protein